MAMVRIFPSNWWNPYEVADDLDVQANRIVGLSKYGQESEMSLPRLTELMKMGTERIVEKMENRIESFEKIAEWVRKSHPSVRSFSSEKIKSITDRIWEIKIAHQAISRRTSQEYIDQHMTLAQSIKALFEELQLENKALQSEIRQKMPMNNFLGKLFAKLDTYIEEIGTLCAHIIKLGSRALKLAGIATLSASIVATANPVQDVVNSTSWKAKLAMEDTSLVSAQVRTALENPILQEKEKSTRAQDQFFQKFAQSPKTIEMIPEFKSDILLPLLRSSTFSSKSYTNGDWETWNMEVVKKIFPRIEGITPENARVFVRALQTHLNLREADGKFWPRTNGRLIGSLLKVSRNTVASKTPDRNKKADIVYPHDKPFASQEEFRELYSPFIKALGRQLHMGNNQDIGEAMIFALAKIESRDGTEIESPTGSAGVLQITRSPFADMKWETRKIKKHLPNGNLNVIFSNKFDKRKVQMYQEIFQRIDFSTLKKITYGGKTIGSTLPDEAWAALERIQHGTLMEVSDTIEELQQYEKGDLKKGSVKTERLKNSYFHTLNMVIGGVYTAFISDNRLRAQKGKTMIDSSDVIAIAKRYNGEANQKMRNAYAKRVYLQYKKEAQA